MRSDHPLVKAPLTLETFLQYGHAVVRAEGRGQEILEQYLRSQRIQRRAILETSNFMSLPMILSRTNLIATVPHAIGIRVRHGTRVNRDGTATTTAAAHRSETAMASEVSSRRANYVAARSHCGIVQRRAR